MLGSFLQSICVPAPLTIVRQLGGTASNSNNRVPQPIAADFLIMSSIGMPRLSYNITTYMDNIVTGAIAGTTLTVTSITKGNVPLGTLLFDGNNPQKVAPNTIILSQISGTPNGLGTYEVSVSQTVASETMYPGVRSDIAPAQWTVQLDIHGPNSMQNVRIIDTLFRSDYGTDYFNNAGFPGAPLYCSDPRQAPFENAEQQMEYRWVMDVNLDLYVTIGTPQQFASSVTVKTIQASQLPFFIVNESPLDSGYVFR